VIIFGLLLDSHEVARGGEIRYILGVMEQTSHSTIVQNTSQSTLLNLPLEVLVFIVSFLPTREKVKIRCVSKSLHSVSEVPSLWEEFIWSHYHASRDEKLLKYLLKMFGKHIKRFHFADKIPPSKLMVMLKFCRNVAELSLPSVCYHEKLEKILCSMSNIQILHINLKISSINIQPLFTLSGNCNLKELSLTCITVNMQQLLEEWANFDYVPRKLNIFVRESKLPIGFEISQLQSCLPMLRAKKLPTVSDSDDTAWFSVYIKTPVITSFVPIVQLKVTNSSIMIPSVNASKFGILGLDFDTLLLTHGHHHGKKVHKALLQDDNVELLDTSITSLCFVTFFDASCCYLNYFDPSCCESLYPGHLEQLSIACPNLERLNLFGNSKCLSTLQGLHSLASNCKNLRELNLKQIHVSDHEYDCLQLWEILFMMQLRKLGIDAWMIDLRNAELPSLPPRDCPVVMKQQKLIDMFQKYSSLQILEVDIAKKRLSDNDLLILSYFPSIISCRLFDLPSNNCYHTLKRIFSWRYLKCLSLSKISGMLSLSLEGQLSLQKLYIESRDTFPTDSFISALSSHGGLEHVLLCVKSLTASSITNIIESSSNLVTFNVYLCSRTFSRSQLKQLTVTVKAKFSKRKLFNGGNFTITQITNSFYSALSTSLRNTDLLSAWNV